MAILNTNTTSTKLGVDITSMYTRLEIYLGTGNGAEIGFHCYASKQAFLDGESMINNMLDGDYSNYSTGVLVASDVTLDNLHDLAIAELVNRGLDVSKLAKADLV